MREAVDIGDPAGVRRALEQSSAMAQAVAPILRQIAEQNSKRVAAILTSDFHKAIRSQQPLVASIQITGLFDNVPKYQQIITANLPAMNLLAEQIQGVVGPLNNAIQESIKRSMAGIDFAGIQELVARGMPPNWPHRLKLEVARRLVNEYGLPLVWVPGATVVTMLAEAPDAKTRRAVLVKNQAAIIADVRACLDELEGFEEVEAQADLLRKAAAAIEGGHTESGQALATDVLDALVSAHVAAHTKVAKAFKPLGDDTAFVHLIYAATLSPLVLAYEPFWVDRGDPIPVTYNRHATVHAGNPTQFTSENALIALMLATSIARTVKHYAETEKRDAA